MKKMSGLWSMFLSLLVTLAAHTAASQQAKMADVQAERILLKTSMYIGAFLRELHLTPTWTFEKEGAHAAHEALAWRGQGMVVDEELGAVLAHKLLSSNAFRLVAIYNSDEGERIRERLKRRGDIVAFIAMVKEPLAKVTSVSDLTFVIEKLTYLRSETEDETPERARLGNQLWVAEMLLQVISENKWNLDSFFQVVAILDNIVRICGPVVATDDTKKL